MKTARCQYCLTRVPHGQSYSICIVCSVNCARSLAVLGAYRRDERFDRDPERLERIARLTARATRKITLFPHRKQRRTVRDHED